MNGSKVTCHELAKAVAERCGLPATVARRNLDALVTVARDMLRDGRVVELRGLGAWRPVDVPSGPGRNPLTGEAVHVPARRRVRFRAATRLRAALRAAPLDAPVEDGNAPGPGATEAD